MKKILFVNACVRGNSRTKLLADHVLSFLDGELSECNLDTEKILPLDSARLAERDRLSAAGDFSAPMFRYARKFAEADTIVIAAPYWDLAFPALLKTYLENITVSGVTFYYDDHGIPRTMCRAKQLIYVTTSGGPIFANLGFDYVKTVASAFFGIEDILLFKAENLDVIGMDVDVILNNAKQEIGVYFVK